MTVWKRNEELLPDFGPDSIMSRYGERREARKDGWRPITDLDVVRLEKRNRELVRERNMEHELHGPLWKAYRLLRTENEALRMRLWEIAESADRSGFPQEGDRIREGVYACRIAELDPEGKYRKIVNPMPGLTEADRIALVEVIKNE